MSNLRDELLNDPNAAGYAAMSDLEAAASLNAKTVTGRVTTLTKAEIFDTFDPTESDAIKTDAVKMAELDRILSLDNPIIGKNGTLAFNSIVVIFGTGSATVTKLKQARKITISRASELGLSRVREGTVKAARS